MESTNVKHEDGSTNISAFAYDVGRTLDNMINIRNKEIIRNSEFLQVAVFKFRHILEGTGTQMVDASELLGVYDEIFSIKND